MLYNEQYEVKSILCPVCTVMVFWLEERKMASQNFFI